MPSSGILSASIFGLLAGLFLLTTEASPMYYKKVAGQKYEPDWVAVSSTVIPLAEYRVSVGGGGGAGIEHKAALVADEYRRAYLRHKKLSAAANGGNKAKKDGGDSGPEATAALIQDDADTLITAKKKFYERKNR